MIGERVRDKIAASKRKGIWVGGPVPLGYAAMDKKATVEPAEAETVRSIFTRYLELGSVRALAEDLERRGIRTRQRQLKDGRILGGAKLNLALVRNVRTWPAMPRERRKRLQPRGRKYRCAGDGRTAP